MSHCQWQPSGDGFVCQSCGTIRPMECVRECAAEVKSQIVVELPTVTGLGDYTEQLLSSIGVTKDRYSAAKELFGLAPTCNCETRKEWLNKVGAWLGI